MHSSKFKLSSTLIAVCCFTLVLGCDSTQKVTPNDSGTTSNSLDLTIQSNETALKRADLALKDATTANNTIRSTIPQIAKEAAPEAKTHTSLWSHVNTIENASLKISTSLEDLHTNQKNLSKQLGEVRAKEKDLAARENKVAEIEAENLQHVLGGLRIAMVFGAVLVAGGILMSIITPAKRTGVLIAISGFIIGLIALMVSMKYKELSDIAYWLVLAGIVISAIAALITFKVGRNDEISLAKVGELLDHMNRKQVDGKMLNLLDDSEELSSLAADALSAYQKQQLKQQKQGKAANVTS